MSVFQLAVGRLLVFVQVRLESESFVALRATETLRRRVGLHMGAKVRTIGERLAASVASVRFFSRV